MRTDRPAAPGRVLHGAGPFAREVLPERAAERHVHHLEPPADGEHRQARVARMREQGDLHQVPPAVDRPERRAGRLAVERRIHILAAREQQAVHPVEQFGVDGQPRHPEHEPRPQVHPAVL
jgi:hypothetical protein